MLEFKNFSLEYKNYGGENYEIFDNINLTFEKGTINVITGKSGSGKSSIIKVINGIIPEITDAKITGELKYDTDNLLEKDITTRSNIISTVFQNPKNQFYAVNSLDEIAFALENRNVPREEIIEKIDKYSRILETEDLLGKDLLKLSGGEKQLVAINSVAVMDNEVYIFDEPSASLDKASIKKLAKILDILKSQNKIIIIAEHRLYYLKNILDKLIVIENKKVISYDKNSLDNSVIKRHNLRTLEDIKEEDFQKKILFNKNLFDKNYEEKSFVCKNFHCKYKESDNEVFDFSISFDSKIYFIIGENGIGKTSFIRNLCGLNKKQRGEIYYKGEIIKNHGKHISLVMQDVNYQLFTDSVYSEISIVTDDGNLKEKTLKEFFLWDKRDLHPQSLSGGEKQRLLLALAKASPKKIVILDEPTSGLCLENMKNLVRVIKEMKEDNKIVIIVTHDYEFIKMASENVVRFVNE